MLGFFHVIEMIDVIDVMGISHFSPQLLLKISDTFVK
jgi:hypothetical protein